MNIDKINRRHLIKQDMFYRVGFGLASQLLKYENGILHIELEIRQKWNKSVDDAIKEISYCWKENHEELSSAVASKVYILDSKKFPYKRTLLHLGIRPLPDLVKGIIFEKNSSGNFS